MDGFNFCTDYHFLEAYRIIKFLITILKIVIPLLLVGYGTYDFFKAVMDSDTMKKQATQFGLRILCALVIFMVPSLVSIFLDLMGDYSALANTLVVCETNATKENIAQMKASALTMANSALVSDKNYEANYQEPVIPSSKGSSSSSSSSSSTSSDGDLSYYDVIDYFEGDTGYCDDAHTQYKAVNIGDGVATAGHGVTSYVYPGLTVGGCYDVESVDAAGHKEADDRKAEVDEMVNQLNITDWSENKTTAAVSIGYNCGSGYTKKVIQNYAASGNEGALQAFKSCTHASNGNDAFTEGLKKRRDMEYDIFINGDYNVIYDDSRASSANRKYVP